MTAMVVQATIRAADQMRAVVRSWVPPVRAERTALTIGVTGWYLAKGWSQPGIEEVGTYVLEMNARTKAIIDMPFAAWALGASRPMTMNTMVKTSPYSRHRPSAASPSAALAGSRKPKANPSAAVKMMDQPLVVKSARVRPVTRVLRAIGRD